MSDYAADSTGGFRQLNGDAAKDEDDMGPECRRCGCYELPVYYTRKRAGKIVRRRVCAHCGQAMTTVERDVAGGRAGADEGPVGKKSSTNGTTFDIPRGMGAAPG